MGEKHAQTRDEKVRKEVRKANMGGGGKARTY
jgi:hypothetical protein